MEQTGCSRVVCPGFHRVGHGVGSRIGSRIDRRKRARSRRPGPATCEWRSSRGAGCHQPDPSLPTTGVRGRAAVTLKSSSKGRWRGREVLEPRGSKWSKWVQGKGERKRRCEEERNREVVAEPKNGASRRRAVLRRDHACAPTRSRRRSARSALRTDRAWRASRRRAVPRRDHACAPTRSRRRSARSA